MQEAQSNYTRGGLGASSRAPGAGTLAHGSHSGKPLCQLLSNPQGVFPPGVDVMLPGKQMIHPHNLLECYREHVGGWNSIA